MYRVDGEISEETSDKAECPLTIAPGVLGHIFDTNLSILSSSYSN